MRPFSKILSVALLLATISAGTPSAAGPPIPIVVRVVSADSTRPVRFTTWATGGNLDIRSSGGAMVGGRIGVLISTPAELTLGEGVVSATFVSFPNSPQLRFDVDAPEATLAATGQVIRFERTASRTGIRVYW